MWRTFARTRLACKVIAPEAPAVRSAEMGPGTRPRPPPIDADDERISLQGPRPSLSVRDPDSSWRFPIWTPVRSLPTALPHRRPSPSSTTPCPNCHVRYDRSEGHKQTVVLTISNVLGR